MSFIISFILPLAGFLTAGVCVLTFWQMRHSQRQEMASESRHVSLRSSQDKIAKDIENVGRKIDLEVIPRLKPTYTKKEKNIFDLSSGGLKDALESIGAACSYVSDDGRFFLVGVEESDVNVEVGGDSASLSDMEDIDFSANQTFKVYYVLFLNEESKDVMIECYAYEICDFKEIHAKALLVLNGKYRVSGLAIEELAGRNILKAQYLLDAPVGYFSAETLDFVLSCLREVTKEAADSLERLDAKPAFIEVYDLLELQSDATTPNNPIQVS